MSSINDFAHAKALQFAYLADEDLPEIVLNPLAIHDFAEILLGRPPSDDLVDDVLTYLDYYHDDVIHHEQEWLILYMAQQQAWHREDYMSVLRIGTALMYVVGRLTQRTVSKHILWLSIEAGRRLHADDQVALFMNRLEGLLYVYGELAQARQLWQTSRYVGEKVAPQQRLWQPLISFAAIVELVDNYQAAMVFAEAYRDAAPDVAVVAIFARGFYARLAHDHAQALTDYRACLQMLHHMSHAPSPHQQIFTLVVQAELARVHNNYERASRATETALTLASMHSDGFTMAVLLIDHGLFMRDEGRLTDLPRIIARLHSLAQQMPFLALRSIIASFERTLTAVAPRHQLTPIVHNDELLSQREIQVLQRIAAGQSNQATARELCITLATVKKHLEHIYIKLNVHNRTQAVIQARGRHLLPET